MQIQHLNFQTSEPNFLDYFKTIKDPRIDRKKLYPMDELLLVAICGVICGAEGWSDLALFGNKKLDYLKTILYHFPSLIYY